jgi:hypothetical protein
MSQLLAYLGLIAPAGAPDQTSAVPDPTASRPPPAAALDPPSQFVPDPEPPSSRPVQKGEPSRGGLAAVAFLLLGIVALALAIGLTASR